MQCVIPEISYHNRDPVLSLDFQPQKPLPGDPLRLATAGSDSHVVIFSVKSVKNKKRAEGEEGVGDEGEGGSSVELECLCDLTRHQKSVNIVRWSPDGTLLASGDDESVIILWQLKPSSGNESSAPRLFDDDGPENKENWVVYKMIRSHLDDVYDLAWSPCSQFLLSGSVDNSAIITNVHKNQKVAILSDSQGFVQGVAWNPKHPVLATLSSDRKCRFYNSNTKKIITRTYKALLNMPTNKLSRKKKDNKDNKVNKESESSKKDENNKMETDEGKEGDKGKEGEKGKEVDKGKKEGEGEEKKQDGEDKVGRLFHDDTFKGFFRRLAWSNDGELLVVPSGVVESDSSKVTHCTFVFTRLELSKPAVCLPTMEKYTIAAKFCPMLFKLRPVKRKDAAAAVSKQDKDAVAPWEKYETMFALPYRMVYAVATQNAVMVYDTQQATPIARVSNIHYTGLTDLSWSPDGQILFVSSTDGFCSIITFPPGELGEVYTPTETTTEQSAEEKSQNDVKQEKENISSDTNDTMNSTSNTISENGKTEEEGFNEHGVKSPAQVRIKSNKEGGKSNPKRLKFITLKSPKAKLPSAHPVNSQIHEENGMDGVVEDCESSSNTDEMEGVVPMEAEAMNEDTLNLQLEDTQPGDSVTSSNKSTPAPSTTDKPEKKRVPLISVPCNNTTAAAPTPTAETGAQDKPQQKKRVELITLSSNNPPAAPVKP